ncbi:RagB/SusD family nutrient uptake outer membrane protein [uncultured Prevotella sp.]|uniref:RagB/SusD family nutrient uptake outer membrane protein n=1 Tax=uncultured Prevotella sp. TaxID=159272 RepID=UPI0026659C3C|nr:RagB/SusD family nutrient uptake outer membrane protein [uncultured Prevotella sp.]
MNIINIKNLLLGAAVTTAAFGLTSCNDLLDMKPISQITPGAYYQNADQLAAYLNNYYDSYLEMPYSGSMSHSWGQWNEGKAKSDWDTDIYCWGGGSTQRFADDHWEVSSGKVLQSYYGGVRVYNYFINTVLKQIENGTLPNSEDVKNYLGEAYFFRALVYFRIMALYGDIPVITEVLPDEDNVIVENSKRTPRNEVARFILSDLDKAIEMCYTRSKFNGQRVNREAALLIKSRIALFEGTFEKYHRGSGRVPGDANWPGAKMSYNQGKTFNQEAEVKFFLTEAKNAAKEVADNADLAENNHKIDPVYGDKDDWNPYFNLFSQPSLANVNEALMWKQYNKDLGFYHLTGHSMVTGQNTGFTRSFIQTFLMKNGMPIYADNSGYHGDVTLDNVKADRDERLQLFMWGESTPTYCDPEMTGVEAGKPLPVYMEEDETDAAHITNTDASTRCITGYQQRKYYTYDAEQTRYSEQSTTNACPIMRSAEALLNYMEADYELNGRLDSKSQEYWRTLRTRAGVDTDFQKTIDATDLSKEMDFGRYSGTQLVDKTLYNIRRERVTELFSEGLRFADLIRWRGFDNMLTTKWVPEGCNFWDNMYKHYDPEIKCNGENDAVVSSKSLGKYLRPYSKSMQPANELKDGYKWHEAYYLYPIGITDIRTASPDRSLENSNLYQNPYWPVSAGGHAEK